MADVTLVTSCHWGDLHSDLAQAIGVGFWRLDPGGRLRYANGSFAGMLGYDPAEQLPSAVTDSAELLKLVQPVEPWPAGGIEIEMRRSDGQAAWLLCNGRAVRSATGGLTCHEGIAIDITERRDREAAVRVSMMAYRQLFTETPDGCAFHEIQCDGSGTPVDYVTLDVNPAFEALLGVSRQVVVGRRASELLPPDELSHWLAVFGPVALTGRSTSYEMFSRHNGKFFQGQAYSPTAGRFVVVFSDVTERKRAQTEAQVTAALTQLRAEALRMAGDGEWPRFVTALHTCLRDLVPHFSCGVNVVRPAGDSIACYTAIGAEVTSRLRPTVGPAVSRAASEGAPIYRSCRTDPLFDANLPPEVNSVVDVPFDGGTLTLGSSAASGFDAGHLAVIGRFASVAGEACQRLGILETERRAHEERDQALTLLATTQRAAKAGAWQWDMISNQLTWSPEFRELFGLDPSSPATFEVWRSVLHPDDLELAERNIAVAIESRTPLENEYRIVFPSGGEAWIRAQGTVEYDAEGTPVRMAGICLDITARKTAETARQESESLFRSLFDNMLNGCAYCRMLYVEGQPTDFIYLAVNDAFGRQTGLQNVTGKRVSELIPGFQATESGLLETYGRVASTGKPETFERFVSSMAQWFSVAVYSPGPEHFVAVFDVVTERKRTEQEAATNLALQRVRNEVLQMEREADWQRVAEQLHGELRRVVGFDQCTINLLDAGGDAVTHYAMGSPDVAPLRGPADDPVLVQVIETGQPMYRRNPLMSPGMSPDVRSVVDVPFSGGTLTVYSTIEDAFTDRDLATLTQFAQVLTEAHQRLSEFIRVETHRRQSQRRLELDLGLQRVRNAVFQMEREDDWGALVVLFAQELGRLVRFGDYCINVIDLPHGSVHAYTGQGRRDDPLAGWLEVIYTKCHATGRSVYRPRRSDPLFNPDMPADVHAIVDAPFAGGTVAISSPFEDPFSDDDIHALEQMATVISEGHRRLQDITARQRLAEAVERQRTQAAEASRLQTLGEMAAGAAHELNQPLNGIRAFAEGAAYGLRHGWHATTDELCDTLDDIVRQVDRMAGIIDHMRGLAHDSSGREMEPVNLADVVEGALKLTQAQLRVHGIGVTIDAPAALPPVTGHPNQLEQVVLNLIANARDALQARKAIEGSGEAWTAHLRITASTDRSGHRVRLAVSDNGGGIPDNVVGRVFDPFFTTKDVGKGTGLGLAIARGIVEEHGGTLELTNRPGDSVTFTITLPVAG